MRTLTDGFCRFFYQIGTIIHQRIADGVQRSVPTIAGVVRRNEMTFPVVVTFVVQIDEDRRNQGCRILSALQTLLGLQRMTHVIRFAHQRTQRRSRLVRVRYDAIVRMRMDEPCRRIYHRRRPLNTLLVQIGVGSQVPDTRTGILHRIEVFEHTGAVDTCRGVNRIPFQRHYRRREEAGEVIRTAFRRHVTLIQRINRLLAHTRPVRDIVIHERRVIDEGLIARDTGLLAHGGKLNIVVDRAAVTPENGVEDLTAVAHIDTARTSVTTTVISHIRTHTVIRRDGTVVHRSAFRQVDTGAFGVGRIIIDYASRCERGIIANIIDSRIAGSRIILGNMADKDTATASRRTGSDLTMPDRALMVDTYTAAVTLRYTDTCGLTCMDIAEVDRTAAIRIDTAASHVRRAALHDTATHAGVTYHIHAAAVACMLTEVNITAGGVTRRDDATVQRCRIFQRLIVVL